LLSTRRLYWPLPAPCMNFFKGRRFVSPRVVLGLATKPSGRSHVWCAIEAPGHYPVVLFTLLDATNSFFSQLALQSPLGSRSAP